MSDSSTVHHATIGPVTATVHYVAGVSPRHYVTLRSRSADCGSFLPEELPQVAEAVEQAQHFIAYQEQIARMNWCPGCGNS